MTNRAPSTVPCLYQVRGPLARTNRALAAGRCTVGFLGGSITAADTGNRWPEPFMEWMARMWPRVRFTVENAAIGATGSDLAAFRVQRDILARGCDLVFVEYSVNDDDQPTGVRQPAREGLLRQLLRGECDVVVVHAFREAMRPAFERGELPASILEFETLAEHYRLCSVNAAWHALREVARGSLTASEWLPDGLHPERRGSECYADAVFRLVRDPRTASVTPDAKALPPPLDPHCWERTHLVPFEQVATEGPWTLRRSATSPWIDLLLHCAEPQARLRFEFEGRGLLAAFDFGHASGEFRHRIDGGAWRESRRERFPWHGPAGWLRPSLLADALAPGRHTCELETLPAATGGSSAATTSIAFFGVMA